jgi:hypothetical protein
MTMQAAKLSLPIQQGATWHKRMVWRDERKRPINLTGYTARMFVRDSIGGSVLLQLTTENGRIVLGGTTGAIALKLTAAETEALTFKDGVYDLKLIIGEDDIRLLEGRVTVSPAVTPRAP